VVALLAGELRPRGDALEVGVGTGRIALPLSATGVSLVGVDLSSAMLAALSEKAGGRPPFPTAVADATRLPFEADRFGGAFAVHVLHLVPEWRSALAELVRVVRPDGVVLLDLGGCSTRVGREVRARFDVELGAGAMANVGLDWGRARIDGIMAGLGAVRRSLPQVSYVERTSLAEHLRLIAEGRYSWTWRVPDDERRAAVDAVRSWALDRFGDLEARRPVRRRIRLRAYDVAGGEPPPHTG
jgi:SAM-dependent methyltransferase